MEAKAVPGALPTIQWNGKTWFVDRVLNQIRNVENPHEFHDISDLGPAVQVATTLKSVTFADLQPPASFPRKKHSHRCLKCGEAVWCYKARCTKPQRVVACQWCR